MLKLISQLRANSTGATAVEYALIVSLIFLAAVGAMQAFGTAAIDMWIFVAGNLDQ